MATRWQQWMPLYIDRFRASPSVQAMHPAARAGFIYLLIAAWQSEDCTVPDNDADLAMLSGLNDLWAQYGAPIRRKFERINVDMTNKDANLNGDRLRNVVLFSEWRIAKHTYERRQDAAVHTNQSRRPRKNANKHADVNGDRDGDRHTITETYTRTKKTKAQAPSSVEIPAYIPLDLWQAYLDMRKGLKKYPTPYACSLILGKLEKFKAADIDPVEALENSIAHCWIGVYEPKSKPPISEESIPTHPKRYRDPRTLYESPEYQSRPPAQATNGKENPGATADNGDRPARRESQSRRTETFVDLFGTAGNASSGFGKRLGSRGGTDFARRGIA